MRQGSRRTEAVGQSCMVAKDRMGHKVSRQEGAGVGAVAQKSPSGGGMIDPEVFALKDEVEDRGVLAEVVECSGQRCCFGDAKVLSPLPGLRRGARVVILQRLPIAAVVGLAGMGKCCAQRLLHRNVRRYG